MARTALRPRVSVRQQARDAAARLDLRRSQLQLQTLEKQAKLKESLNFDDFGWVSIFTELFDRTRRTPEYYGYGSLNDRRYGRNFPIFQTEMELALIRMSSRLLVATNNYASGLLEGLCSYVVEGGFSYHVAAKKKESPVPDIVDAVQAFIDDFHERNQWYGEQEPGIEQELFKRSVEDGEFLVLDAPDPTDPCRTLIRTVEPEQLGQQPGTDWREASFGIFSPKNDAQQRLGYWITFEDTLAKGEFFSPHCITHFRRNVRRSCKRGMPDFSFDTEDSLRVASRLRKALTVGAAVQACIAGVREHDTALAADVNNMQSLLVDYTRADPYTGNVDQYESFKPGVIDMPKSMKWANPPNATNGATHVTILSACLRAAAVKWNAPEWLGSSDASNNNYASSLTAVHPFVKRVKREQGEQGKGGYKAAFTRIHWNALQRYCEYCGGFPVPRRDEFGRTIDVPLVPFEFLREVIEIQVEAPDPQSTDPLQEANTFQIELQNKVTSVRTWQQAIGRDPDVEDANNQEWEDAHGQAMGMLPMPGDQPPGQQPGQPGQPAPHKPPTGGQSLLPRPVGAGQLS